VYYHGKFGQERDEDKAAYWWNEAAQNGYVRAYNNIGIAYKKGIGVKIDLKKAVEWLKKGAETGYDYAQKNYGDMFRDGVKIKIGTHKETRSTTNYIYGDKVIRVVWDGRISSHRYYYWEEVDDSLTLVPKDIEKAKYWWKKAAEQGHSGAKENLEKIYN
jgi:TPR repeat protein